MSELSATTTGTQDAGRPVVGIVTGSDSDWPVMGAAAEVLDDFGVAYEADVVSAHRMPTEMIDYGRAAAERGLRVIIAGAGGAAHLPGMLAARPPPLVPGTVGWRRSGRWRAPVSPSGCDSPRALRSRPGTGP